LDFYKDGLTNTMKFQHLMFDFHGDLNRHHPRKPHRHLVKAHRLPAPSRLSHLSNQRIHKARLATAAQLHGRAHHLALLQAMGWLASNQPQRYADG
jgi:hypothetical protein